MVFSGIWSFLAINPEKDGNRKKSGYLINLDNCGSRYMVLTDIFAAFIFQWINFCSQLNLTRSHHQLLYFLNINIFTHN